ncbi:MAG TPA: DUF6152 family protein [Gammaproteobacteria bacterium]|nr:DUF6152 family protein [Gammaproteobacteria bacterium]
MKMKTFLGVLVLGAFGAAKPGFAHHAFAAEYDATEPLTLTGVVVTVDWSNPHSYIHLDTKEKNGEVKHWMIEIAAPSQLLRHGLRKVDFTDGMTATVKAYQAKTDPTLANGRLLELKDGRSFYIGSVGGPNDGAETQAHPFLQ